MRKGRNDAEIEGRREKKKMMKKKKEEKGQKGRKKEMSYKGPFFFPTPHSADTSDPVPSLGRLLSACHSAESFSCLRLPQNIHCSLACSALSLPAILGAKNGGIIRGKTCLSLGMVGRGAATGQVILGTEAHPGLLSLPLRIQKKWQRL